MTIDTNLAAVLGVEKLLNKNVANGYCPLDASALVPLANIPSLSYLPLAGGTMTGNITQLGNIGAVRSQSSSAIVVGTDYLLNLAPTSGSLTCTFPAGSEVSGQIFIVRRNKSTTGNTVTLQSSTGALFNGTTTYVLDRPFQAIGIQFIGPDWVIVPTVPTFLQLSDAPTSYSGAGNTWVMVNASATALQFVLPTFIGLNDVPSTFSGHGNQHVRVNSGATALEFAAPTFLQLSDGPGSYSGAGSKIVAVNSGATALEFVTQSTLDTPGHLTPAITRYEMPGYCVDVAGSSSNVASGVIYYIPFFVAETTTYTDINVENSASVQTGSVDCRIYNWNGGVPGSQVLNAGTFSWSGESAKTKTITINQSLNRGFYFMAFRLASGTIGLYEINRSGTIPVGGMKAVGTPTPSPSNIITTTVTAAFADPAPAPTGMTAITFMFLMKTHA